MTPRVELLAYSAMALHVAVLSFTAIDHDHRVLRSIAALVRAGHIVTAIGFGDRPAEVGGFVPLPPLPSRTAQRVTTVLTQLPASLLPGSAVPLHFLLARHRAARAALLEIQPDVIHANDCLTLPSAVAAKDAQGARIVYDSHEFAIEEHADNFFWRLIAQRHIREIERRFIGEADHIVTVSNGIAANLQQRYALPVRPTVVRNAPAYQTTKLSPLSKPRRLLFHGIKKRGRGIEAMIAALCYLPDCVLTIRGNGALSYESSLRALASRLDVRQRVFFEAAVPHWQVVKRAAEAHIGIFCAPIQTGQNRYAMPNKIFEYLMAGLAIVVSANTELAELVAQYGCGGVAASSTPEAIAAAINNLSDITLQTMRRRALEAAKRLCWDEEQRALRRVYNEIATDIAASAASP